MRHQRPARERDWLELLFDRHATQLRAFAVRRVAASNADDIVADVFATAWRRREYVPDPALPWLYQTARNVILHHLSQRSASGLPAARPRDDLATSGGTLG